MPATYRYTTFTLSHPQSELDVGLFQWLAGRNLPFQYVRHAQFASFLQIAVPGYSPPAAETLNKMLDDQCHILRTEVLSFQP